MVFPERFSNLPDYAFPRLRKLLDVHEPGGEPISMTIGEPRHAFPVWVGDVIAESLEGFGRYPPNDGTPGLADRHRALDRAALWRERLGRPAGHAAERNARGVVQRLHGALPGTEGRQGTRRSDAEPVLPGLCRRRARRGGGAGLCARHRNHRRSAGLRRPAGDILDRTAIAYICSPANPQGAVADEAYWAELIALAERHDFQIFADECYSEIYRTAPPPGRLAAAEAHGADPERILVFHSLSKRSNLPGLRSGFVAGGPQSVGRMKQLRSYAGAPLPLPLQAVAERAWNDETHVEENRALYQEKYRIADEVMAGVPGYRGPEAGFFLWLPVDDGEAAALKLWREAGVRVLPGHYLARETAEGTPGADRIRVALVAEKEEMRRGLTRLRQTIYE
jgi:N-succinyldiaminopimelate aminotransferase